jgi:serine/threonine protein phosphatase PrpC
LVARALEAGGQDNITLVLVGVVPAVGDLDATAPLGQAV